jgi:N-acyl-D-amino-acid deacylase
MLDLRIDGGEVIDGSGAPRRRADVAVHGGRIVGVGDLGAAPAHRHIDASGQVLAPGFIDSHAHDEVLLLQHPVRHPKLLQGVTTVVTGNCGISLAPLVSSAPPAPLDMFGAHFGFDTFASYVNALEAVAPDLNARLLVGHTTLRVAHVARLDRSASASECAVMRQALAAALQAGAAGLSAGLAYGPAQAADAAELVAVGAPLQGPHDVFAVHLRDEGDHIVPALHEAIGIARALRVPLVLSHHKLLGRRNHGRSAETLALVQAAAREQPLCLDCYPYDASSTTLMPERVAACRDVWITWSRAQPSAAGRSIHALAAEQGLDVQAMAHALLPAGAVYFAMDGADVDAILAHPLAMIGSDGLAHTAPGPGKPHPRLWGSFPRVLGHYSRERALLPLEAAVHKMTGLPAARFGLHGRGRLAVGAVADITVFDPAAVNDRATYAEPETPPGGIGPVLIAGQVVVEGGEVVRHHAGRVLKRGAEQPSA